MRNNIVKAQELVSSDVTFNENEHIPCPIVLSPLFHCSRLYRVLMQEHGDTATKCGSNHQSAEQLYNC